MNVNFPMIMIEDEDYSPNSGNGIGLDVGFQMEKDRLHVGAAA